jgi:hypothetical protein
VRRKKAARKARRFRTAVETRQGGDRIAFSPRVRGGLDPPPATIVSILGGRSIHPLARFSRNSIHKLTIRTYKKWFKRAVGAGQGGQDRWREVVWSGLLDATVAIAPEGVIEKVSPILSLLTLLRLENHLWATI